MAVTLNEETQRLIERRMAQSGVTSADRIVQLALESLDDGVDAGFLEDLDSETLAAIERGNEEADRGEGRPWEDVREELRKKYLPGK